MSVSAPLVTVMMPVYNGKAYLREAIDSVLAQTLTDWELLLIDDGSTDGSVDFIGEHYTDARIRVLANDRNRGVAYTRNAGIDAARGEFLAWLDSDDIMSPDRLQSQVAYLHRRPELGACGTWIRRFGAGRAFSSRQPESPEIVRGLLLFTPIVPNATVMLRLALVRQFGLRYDHGLPIAEDYDFVLKCSQHFSIGILPRVLYSYRVAENSLTQRLDQEEESAFAISKIVHGRALAKFGISATDEELRTHRILNSGLVFTIFEQYAAAFDWLLRLLRHNEEVKFYELSAFRRVAANRFFFISKKASLFGIRTLVFYVRNAVAHNLLYLSPLPLVKFLVRCFIRYDKF